MNRKILRMLLLAVTALFLGTAAYGQDVKVRVTLPFDFILDDNLYPAGEYVIQTAAANSFRLMIVSEKGDMRVFMRSFPCTTSKALQPAEQTKLVFHRVNNTYFLFQIWSEDSSFGRQFSRGHTETLMARNNPTSEVVVAAAGALR